MRPALRLIPLMVVGGLAAFLLVGPLSQLYRTHTGSRPLYPSTTPLADASAASCPALATSPPATAAPPGQGQPLFPAMVWVNDPLGVNVRTQPSVGSAKLTTLSQGAQVTADQQARDAAGALWYHVSIGAQAGWLRADFVVTVPIHVASGPGWALMLPAGYAATQLSAGQTEVRSPGDADIPFLRVQATTDDQGVNLPGVVRAATLVGDHSRTIQVWSYTVLERVYRVELDSCKLPAAGARPDGGWPWMTAVVVHTPTRFYRFTFFTAGADSPLVDQVLASVSLN